MTEQLNAASAADETSLRDELANEWAKMSAEPTTEPVQEAVQDATEPTEGRARDDKGRFAAQQTQQDAQATAPVSDAAKAPEATGDADKAQSETRYNGPPPGWSVAAKAAFDALPGDVKQAIAKREEEIDKGFAKLKEYKELEKTLTPHMDTARQYGVDLPELLNRYEAAEKFLQTDPKNAIMWLCQSYKLDPRELLGGNAQPQQQAPQQGQIDPSVQPLLQKIQMLEEKLGRVDQIERSLYDDKFSTVSMQVEHFFADPQNKFAENVADQMVLLINEARASGQPVDLNSIYETACYMNPEVRQALINERLTSEQKAQASKAKQAADQARLAGASISGSPAASQPTGDPDSENLRALLERNFAAQVGRI